MKFFENRATDGNSAAEDWPSGCGTARAWGTFDGATVTLQASFDGGTTWIDVGEDATFTAAGMTNFSLGPCKLRGVVSGAGGTTSVSLAV
ncbi:MAG: hypothetical protein WCY11_15935 [Novosphingobium sp.]